MKGPWPRWWSGGLMIQRLLVRSRFLRSFSPSEVKTSRFKIAWLMRTQREIYCRVKKLFYP